MRRLIAVLTLLILATGGLWLSADTLLPKPYDARKLSESFTHLSGILTIAMMSCAVLLATRPKWMEPTLNGLDKMYRLGERDLPGLLGPITSRKRAPDPRAVHLQLRAPIAVTGRR